MMERKGSLATWLNGCCEDEWIERRGKMRTDDDRYHRKAEGVGKRRLVAQPNKWARTFGIIYSHRA